MVIAQVLKRKDGASLVVGIVVALILSTLVSGITADVAGRIAGLDGSGSGPGWQSLYFHPIVWALLQLVVLELLIRLYVAVRDSTTKK